MAVDASSALLCWYAVDKRPLAWRPAAGERPDPYRIWLSEVMLQQTTVAHASPYYEAFLRRWPDLASLAAAEDGEVMAAWAGLGYYSRARNLLACARTITADHGGEFPDSEDALKRLPGIGPYMAAAIAAIAFGRRALAMDANVERIVARLFAVQAPLPSARKELRRLGTSLLPPGSSAEFTQAMMELGQRVCTPRAPDCDRCPLAGGCAARRLGMEGRIPVRAPRGLRPVREGKAFWLEHGDEVLLVRRPACGLLGGMLALPTEDSPAALEWTPAGSVDHVFTHFALTMTLYCARAPVRPPGRMWPVERLGEAGLPTLFRKLAERGRAWREAA